MSLVITEELIACRPAEAQAIIRLLLARIAELEARLGKTPQNSSLPHLVELAHRARELGYSIGQREALPIPHLFETPTEGFSTYPTSRNV